MLFHNSGTFVIPARALGGDEAVRRFNRMLEENIHPPLRAFPVVPRRPA